MKTYIKINDDLILTNKENLLKSDNILKIKEADLFTLKAYIKDGDDEFKLILDSNLSFIDAIESINRVFTHRVEVYNQTTNKVIVVGIDKRFENNKREKYNTNKTISYSAPENYVPMFREDKPRRVSYVSYR